MPLAQRHSCFFCARQQWKLGLDLISAVLYCDLESESDSLDGDARMYPEFRIRMRRQNKKPFAFIPLKFLPFSGFTPINIFAVFAERISKEEMDTKSKSFVGNIISIAKYLFWKNRIFTKMNILQCFY